MTDKLPNTLSALRIRSPLGEILLAASPKGLAGAWFTQGQRDTPDASACTNTPDHALLQQAARELNAYFAGTLRSFTLPLDLSSGTPFQQAVWHGLCTLGFGQTTSYGALAAQIGRPRAVRALGAAVGANPVSVIVPCHRVIGANGALTGYSGGLERKVALLALEGVR